MNKVHNVTRLHEQKSVFQDIKSFLRNKGVKSKNTEAAYEGDIRQFFKYMRNKDIEQLVESDLHFKNADMMDYQTYLYREYVQPKTNKRYSNLTINRKINTIYSLYLFLKKNEYNVDPVKLKVDDLPDDSKQIGFLTVEEIDHMLMLTEDVELKAFIMLALRTSSRKNALLNLTWEQITKSHDNEDMYHIKSLDFDDFDKGSKVEKEIHKDMYEFLLQLKVEGDNKVFHTPESTLEYRFKALCKKAGIDKNRKVSIHSLKKAGVSYVKELTGDIYAAQMQAGHKSIQTTTKYYLEKHKNIAGMSLDTKIDESVFDQLSHDELLKMVKGFGNGIGHQLRITAKKIIDTRK